MNTVGLNKDVDALRRWSPSSVGGDMAPDQGAEHIDTHQHQRPRDEGTGRRPQAVDAKQFQV